MKPVFKWYSTSMALAAALIYILAGAGILYYGDLVGTGEAPPFIFFVAGAFYILVGWLVRPERRRLRITLAVVNLLVIIIFFQMWFGRPDVLTSAAGLGTKIAQALLEIGLFYLIFTTERRISKTEINKEASAG